ncbi:MAG: S8 family peptidase [Bacteroidetes bacterium]|nr:S8 family peptidase [Bacteroidota bacterium]
MLYQKSKVYVWAVLCATTMSFSAMGQQQVPARPDLGMDPALRDAMNRLPDSARIRVIVYCKQPDLLKQVPDLEVNSHFGGLLTASLPIGGLGQLLDLAQVEDVYYGQMEWPMLDSVKAHTFATAIHKGWGHYAKSFKGKGVIVGIVDSGIDFDHLEFREEGDNTKTRIHSIWCQWDDTGLKPDSFSYGSEYLHGTIQAAIDGHGSLPQTDYDPTQRGGTGHGTHVAGIAAGLHGMAPQAEIVAVSVTWESAAIVDAVKYVIDKAILANKPCVVNLSLGSMNDLHDGTGLRAEAYAEVANLRPEGSVIVAAAGNSGNSFVHWGNFELGEGKSIYAYGHPVEMVMAIPDSLADSIWFRVSRYKGGFSYADDRFDNLVQVGVSPWYSPWQALTDSVAYDFMDGGGQEISGSVYLSARPVGHGSRHHYALLRIDDHADIDVRQSPPKANGIDLYLIEVKGAGSFHAWLQSVSTLFTGSFSKLATDPGKIGAEQPKDYQHPDNDYTILAPALYKETFCVGAYVNRWSYMDVNGALQPARWSRRAPGSLSTFSSRGPTVDGRVLPELVAPGQNVLAAIPDYYKGWSVRTGDGTFAASSGTSMSSPAVAGAVALYLQQMPNATLDDVRRDFLSYAYTDSFTESVGELPNNHWGHGKLNVYGSLSGGLFFSVNEREEGCMWLYPNPTNGQVFGGWPCGEAVVLNLQGQVVGHMMDNSFDASGLAEGMYLVKPQCEGGGQPLRLVKY